MVGWMEAGVVCGGGMRTGVEEEVLGCKHGRGVRAGGQDGRDGAAGFG